MRRLFLVLAPLLLAGAAAAQDRADTARQRELAPLGPKPEKTVVTADHDGLTLFVKFRDGSGVRLVDGRFQAPDPEIEAVDALVDSIGGFKERLWEQPDEELELMRANGEARIGRPLHDLTLFYKVSFSRLGVVGEACDALNQFDVVRVAWPVGTVSDPVVPASAAPASAPFTPDFQNLQVYRGPAPNGVAADYGNTFSGGLGTGITIVDVETGWTDDHEDIAHKALDNFVGMCCAPYPWDHGTAVLGELVGEHQGLGVKGIVYDSDVLMSTHQGNGANVPTAIMNALAAADPGDVVVLEVQCFQGPPSPHPCEWDDATFASIETGTANGIHVFAAAGNGNQNLDSAAYGGKFDRNVRDSGSVMVGASDGINLDKASFSNYGSRLDAHGWGWDVTTSGYGDLHNNGTQETYTAAFSGTSSATPIVTGAGIQLIGIHKQVTTQDIDPFVLRDLLTQTGTPQGAGGQIGPRPNVHAAIEDLNFPRISVSGNLVPGGSFTVTSHGVPGDGVVMVFGSSVNVHTPNHVFPYGYFMLSGTIKRVVGGALDGNGELSYTEAIPANTPPGTTLGYYLTWQRFLSGQPGVGAFGNYVAIEVQ